MMNMDNYPSKAVLINGQYAAAPDISSHMSHGLAASPESQYWRHWYNSERERDEIGASLKRAAELKFDMINEIKTAMERHASRSIPIRPRPLAMYAAYANIAAKTPKERRLADLMVFVAKYREHKPGIVIFPAWLSEDGRKRLLDIANRH